MKVEPKKFRVGERAKIKLKEWPTDVKPFYKSKQDYRKTLARHIEQLSVCQDLLYASDRYALLIIFQAMDAAGKDSSIKHVMSGVNPQACEVTSFKQPSVEELQHDFLWRTTRRLPARGTIGIFNRSYYEEVLVARVHPELLRAQKIPAPVSGKLDLWKGRFRSIRDLEAHLHRNGTRIIKFFLHVSREEQRKRFLRRIDDPAKNWKYSEADVHERELWNKYMAAYEECLGATSTADAPWHIVPADDKKNARLIVSQVILNTLQELHMSYPEPDRAQRHELRAARKLLEKQS